MNSNIVYSAIIILVICLWIIWFGMRDWTVKNKQQSIKESMTDNIEVFKRIIHDNTTLLPVYARGKIIGTNCNAIYKAALQITPVICCIVVCADKFLKLNNHGPNPCDIKHIDINKDIDCSIYFVDEDEFEVTDYEISV